MLELTRHYPVWVSFRERQMLKDLWNFMCPRDKHCTRLHKKIFVSPATFLSVEMCHQNSVIRDIKLDQKGRDSRHNLATQPKTMDLEVVLVAD